MSTSTITDREIALEFMGTNFGGADQRKLIEIGVLKKAMGYSSGHTLTSIMERMNLIGKNGDVLVRGKLMLRDTYGYLVKNGG